MPTVAAYTEIVAFDQAAAVKVRIWYGVSDCPGATQNVHAWRSEKLRSCSRTVTRFLTLLLLPREKLAVRISPAAIGVPVG